MLHDKLAKDFAIFPNINPVLAFKFRTDERYQKYISECYPRMQFRIEK